MCIRKSKLTVRELTLFSMLGALMFLSKVLMEALPNIHLLGMLTMTYTLSFRKKALIPLYVYVVLNGLFSGFNLWWVPYLYIWTVLWAVTMLLPKAMPKAVAYVVYPVVCALHGLLFGTLYAPVQAVVMGLTFQQTVAWIVAGLPYDAIHAAGNLAFGFFILPISTLLKQVTRRLFVTQT